MDRHVRQRRRKTLNEELLAQGLGEAQSETSEPSSGEEPSGRRVATVLLVPLLFGLAGVLVHQVSWQAGLAVGVLGILVGWWLTETARRGSSARRDGPFRAFVLVGLAVAVAATVMVGVAGFHQEDLLFLAVIWAAWVALWAVDRLLARLLR
jgi:hypothetical protein